MASTEDKSITCVDCGQEFLFTAGEQAFYRERGLTNEPTRCKSCREKRKTARPAGGSHGSGGGVQFGLITDRKLCPDPENIIARFAPEFEKLLMVTLMLPWGEEA